MKKTLLQEGENKGGKKIRLFRSMGGRVGQRRNPFPLKDPRRKGGTSYALATKPGPGGTRSGRPGSTDPPGEPGKYLFIQNASSQSQLERKRKMGGKSLKGGGPLHGKSEKGAEHSRPSLPRGGTVGARKKEEWKAVRESGNTAGSGGKKKGGEDFIERGKRERVFH